MTYADQFLTDVRTSRPERFLERRDMNIALEHARAYTKAQPFIRVCDEAVMSATVPVTLVNKGILTMDHFDRRIVLAQRGEVKGVLLVFGFRKSRRSWLAELFWVAVAGGKRNDE